MKNGTKGFTLLEILIVLVILAVLAGLAIPAYTGTVEKNRKQEAYGVLSATRASQQRYYALNNAYATPAQAAMLDFDPTNAATMYAAGAPYAFTYTLGGGGATFTCTATRTAAGGVALGAGGAYTVQINQAGTVTSSY